MSSAFVRYGFLLQVPQPSGLSEMIFLASTLAASLKTEFYLGNLYAPGLAPSLRLQHARHPSPTYHKRPSASGGVPPRIKVWCKTSYSTTNSLKAPYQDRFFCAHTKPFAFVKPSIYSSILGACHLARTPDRITSV